MYSIMTLKAVQAMSEIGYHFEISGDDMTADCFYTDALGRKMHICKVTLV